MEQGTKASPRRRSALTHIPLVRALSTSMRCVAVADDEYADLDFDLALKQLAIE